MVDTEPEGCFMCVGQICSCC